jgi:hypothetical protein
MTRPLVLVALALQLGASPAQAAPAASWDAFTAEYIEATFDARPQLAVWAGRHEFDGLLPDWSPAGFRKEIARLHEARQRALGFQDAALTPEQRFERDYLVAVIDRSLFWLETAHWQTRSPGYYNFNADSYITHDYAPLPQRMQAYIAYARSVPKAVEQMRANLRTPMPRSYVRLGHIIAGGSASLYENDIPKIFAPVESPALQEDFRDANAGAIAAMKSLDAWFTQQEAHATEDFALGSRMYSTMLRATEGIDVPVSHLKEIAERDLERNLAALRTACAALAPGRTLDECVATTEADKPSGDALEMARSQLRSLRTFVEEKSLVTIPGSEEARVAPTLPHERWNLASIDIPGPFEKNLPSIFYITPPDPKWTKAEQDEYIPSRSLLLFISVHEVWPGHFLQFQHSNRSTSAIARLFQSYTFAEGWAHYSEELMWEAGLGEGDPAVHVGQIREALLRDVRLVSAIGLHTGGMSIADSQKMFREKAFQDAGNARQQADRGTFDPGYGAYTLGKLMIRKLRDDWTATRGGRDAWHAFHDRLLSYGSPPVPMVRKAMLGDRAGPPL